MYYIVLDYRHHLLVVQDAEWHSHHLFLAQELHHQYLQAAGQHQPFLIDLVRADHRHREVILAYLHLWYHRKYDIWYKILTYLS